MKDVKTIVITIERESGGESSASQISEPVCINRVIHMDGKELYRDELKEDVGGSIDIISQLECFLEGRKFNRVTALPVGAKKWKLFSGTETIPKKEVPPISINIESLTGSIHVSVSPDIQKGSLAYSPCIEEIRHQLCHNLIAELKDVISTWEKSNGIDYKI